MSDVFSKQKRASIMSANRGRGNRSTERRIRARLAATKTAGWRLNARDVFGKPDFVFDNEKLAVFVDGCFWHGCRQCRSIPESNRDFWQEKIKGNKRRDTLVTRRLRKDGWTVVRFWEHQVRREPQKCILKIQETLARI
jgi:DNA mismatch endonuclease, patch repair protein